MTEKTRRALDLFQEGWNCSQSVLAAFGEDLGFDSRIAFRIGQPFGGGMARQGRICGAVSGAMLVLGLAYGRERVDDEDAQNRTYAAVQELFRSFRERHVHLNCRDLLGIDLTSEEQRLLAQEQGVFDDICPKLVRSTGEILEKILNPAPEE